MINKKLSLVFILALAIMFIPLLVSAESQQSMPDQKLGDLVRLTQSGDVSGVPFTGCNITSLRINNGTNLITASAMTEDNGEFYYDVSADNLGSYIARGECNGYNWVFDFKVTPTGIANVSIWDNSFLLILLGITIILFVAAFAMKSFPLAVMAGFGFMVSGVYTMINGFSNYADDYTRFAALFLIAIGMILAAVSGYEWIADNSEENESSVTSIEEEEE